MHWPNLDQLSRARRGEVRHQGSRRLRLRVRGRRALTTCTRACAAVLFSPVHGVLAPRELAGWMLDARVPARLQLQAHKYIWSSGDARRLMAQNAPSSCSRADSIRPRPRRWRDARAWTLYGLTVRYGQVHAVRDRGGAPRRRGARLRATRARSTSTSRRSAGRRWSATARSRTRTGDRRPIATRSIAARFRPPTCRRATP